MMKLVGFGAVLVTVFAAALGVGAAVGPIDTDDDADQMEAMSDEVTEEPRGLAVAEAGHRLVLERDTVAADASTELEFAIVDTAGAAVTAFDDLHERPLHLIVLSRNLVDYHHLHPQMDPDGHWAVSVPQLHPGSYRVFADFQPTGGSNITLAADLAVPGGVEPPDVPEPATTASVDGYDVAVDGAAIVGESDLTFRVQRDGADVLTEPYLGAAGHLVAIRGGDLAYLHVHPHDSDGSQIPFTAEFPSAGTYRLFLDFAHAGTVRTAAFTVVVGDQSAATSTSEHADGH